MSTKIHNIEIPANVAVTVVPPGMTAAKAAKKTAPKAKKVGASAPAARPGKKAAAPKAKTTKIVAGKKVTGKKELQKGRTYSENDQISQNVKENPKRKTSASFKRFQLYRTCGTVGEYLDACVKLELTQGKPRGHYLADLRWDLEHGFIAIMEAKK